MKNNKIDLVIAVCIICLTMFGLVMVFGASSMMAVNTYDSLTHFFKKQVLWAIVTIGLIITFSKFDYNTFKRDGIPVLLVLMSIALLIGLFFFGREINGAKRWYSLGLMNFQPSELARISLIIYLSYVLTRKGTNIKDFKEGLLPKLIIIAMILIPIFLQPDLSTSLMVAMIAFIMLYLAGAKVKHLLGMTLPVIPLIILIMRTNSYQWQRILNWSKGLSNPLDAVYQIKQSLIGLGSGGWTGVGIGESKQKWLFLPDSHTDFIFSIIGEEFGFIGTSLVLFVFLILLFRGLRLARISTDPFAQMLAAGITVNMVLYAFINAAVVTSLVPATGLPMPFISYGGSHLVFLGISSGILLNISRHTGIENWEEFKQKREAITSTFMHSA